MSYREEELDNAIMTYVRSLDLEELIDYVTYDLMKAYKCSSETIVDVFITQMEGVH